MSINKESKREARSIWERQL